MVLSLNHIATSCIVTCPFTFGHVLDKLEQMLANADCNSQIISSVIMTDPMLCALVLSRANATEPGLYIHLSKAVSVLGLSSIYGFSDECLRISPVKRPAMANLWASANACASMCTIVANQCRIEHTDLKDPEINSTVGLIHDIGSIIGQCFFNNHFKLAQKNVDLCGLSLQEQLKKDFGLRPSDLGSILAKSWHFPQIYADAIRFHRRPLDCAMHIEFACLAHISHHLCRACGYKVSCEPYVESIIPESLEILGLKERQLKNCIQEFMHEDHELSLYESYFQL